MEIAEPFNQTTGLISADKAYSIAHDEGRRRIYAAIENAAKCGNMYYDIYDHAGGCESLASDVVNELKEAGYKVSPCASYTRISWRK